MKLKYNDYGKYVIFKSIVFCARRDQAENNILKEIWNFQTNNLSLFCNFKNQYKCLSNNQYLSQTLEVKHSLPAGKCTYNSMLVCMNENQLTIL